MKDLSYGQNLYFFFFNFTKKFGKAIWVEYNTKDK